MIIRIVKMTFQEGNISEFINIYEVSKDKIKGMNGCIYLELLQDIHSENVFFTYSHWETEYDLNNYKKSNTFAAIWPKTKLLFSEEAVAWSTEIKG